MKDERPMHRLDCTCDLCVLPAEPTRWQVLSLVMVILAVLVLLWWRG